MCQKLGMDSKGLNSKEWVSVILCSTFCEVHLLQCYLCSSQPNKQKAIKNIFPTKFNTEIVERMTQNLGFVILKAKNFKDSQYINILTYLKNSISSSIVKRSYWWFNNWYSKIRLEAINNALSFYITHESPFKRPSEYFII